MEEFAGAENVETVRRWRSEVNIRRWRLEVDVSKRDRHPKRGDHWKRGDHPKRAFRVGDIPKTAIRVETDKVELFGEKWAFRAFGTARRSGRKAMTSTIDASREQYNQHQAGTATIDTSREQQRSTPNGSSNRIEHSQSPTSTSIPYEIHVDPNKSKMKQAPTKQTGDETQQQQEARRTSGWNPAG